MLEVRFREATRADDIGLVMDPWLTSFQNFSMSIGMNYSVIRDMVTNKVVNSKTILAVNPEDDTQIFGFICYKRGILHFIYVKEVFRKNKVAKQLMRYAGFSNQNKSVYTTFPFNPLLPYSMNTQWKIRHLKKKTNWIYDPHSI